MKALKINSITPGKRADQAGLHVGDIIVRYNSIPVGGDINAMAVMANEQTDKLEIPIEVLTQDGLKTLFVEGGSLSIIVEAVDITQTDENNLSAGVVSKSNLSKFVFWSKNKTIKAALIGYGSLFIFVVTCTLIYNTFKSMPVEDFYLVAVSTVLDPNFDSYYSIYHPESWNNCDEIIDKLAYNGFSSKHFFRTANEVMSDESKKNEYYNFIKSAKLMRLLSSPWQNDVQLYNITVSAELTLNYDGSYEIRFWNDVIDGSWQGDADSFQLYKDGMEYGYGHIDQNLRTVSVVLPFGQFTLKKKTT